MFPRKENQSRWCRATRFSTCSLGPTASPCILSDASIRCQPIDAASVLTQRLVVADIDAATAKLAIGFLGPFFSAFSFLFIVRIVMSWYPKLPVSKFPYVIAYAPTEPILILTRKLIPPLGGVDVTPVVWFGLVSFLNEILVGPQGLLVLLSQQVRWSILKHIHLLFENLKMWKLAIPFLFQYSFIILAIGTQDVCVI